MKRNNGITLIALIITIIILVILAGVSVAYVTGDNGVITNAMKMELDTAKGEVRDHFRLRITEETAAAAASLVGTVKDLGTKYNEEALINYLTGTKNYPNQEYEEKIAERCIEEFENETANGVVPIPSNGDDGYKLMYNNEELNITVKSKYRIIPEVLSASGDKYGRGKNIQEGNIFTLEAVGISDGTYSGKYELVYYDKDNNSLATENNDHRFVIDTYSLYLTNQS